MRLTGSLSNVVFDKHKILFEVSSIWEILKFQINLNYSWNGTKQNTQNLADMNDTEGFNGHIGYDMDGLTSKRMNEKKK